MSTKKPQASAITHNTNMAAAATLEARGGTRCGGGVPGKRSSGRPCASPTPTVPSAKAPDALG